jgi:hypothetical protein
MRNWKQGDAMSWRHREPTLDEMLSDPIVRSLMRADGVDRMGLEIMVRHIAAEQAGEWWLGFHGPRISPDVIEQDWTPFAPGDRPEVPMSRLWAG